jgi:predicted site-specific integrase-resolvase
MESKWYTYKQIIEMFGICKQTLNNWRRNGNIIYKKISYRTYMYKIPETKVIQEKSEKEKSKK